LELCGGLDLIEPLQMHANHQIYERAVKILEEYFTEEENGTMFD
jgi:importin subunit alpha-1